MRMEQRSLGCIARPGSRPHYTIDSAARLLGIGHTTLRRLIADGLVRAKQMRGSGHWRISRSEICRFARIYHADRPLRLARVLSEHCNRKPLRLLAVTDDPDLRKNLQPFDPVYCSSLFALGQRMLVLPAWGILIDWQTVGSSWAKDAAARLFDWSDRPKLIGMLPIDVAVKGPMWDLLIERPTKPKDLQRLLQDRRKN